MPAAARAAAARAAAVSAAALAARPCSSCCARLGRFACRTACTASPLVTGRL